MEVANTAACRAELHRQFERFRTLMGRLPSHVDSHHNVHLDPRLSKPFLDLAEIYDLPLRNHRGIRYFGGFYGQWYGETHPEEISVEMLTHMLAQQIGDGVTEFGCHSGYVDPNAESLYHTERERELETLCDPRVQDALRDLEIQLVGFRDVKPLSEPNSTEPCRPSSFCRPTS